MMLLEKLRTARDFIRLPSAAKNERLEDRTGPPKEDPGIEQAIKHAVNWLCLSQDRSRSHDGGSARHFSLFTGWSTSYPETTGYIIPTILKMARLRHDQSLRNRARRMLNWLVSIQLPDGGFQGGTIDSRPLASTTFNTGQILIGLADGAREFEETYLDPMCRAADWLVKTQDPDGCWRSHPSPFCAPGEKTYETHVAWGLFEAARLVPDRSYQQAALSNIQWALKFQYDNGWFEKCCLQDPARPLTHTLGYVLRGILEAYSYTESEELLEKGLKTADGLLSALQEDGFLSGRLDQQWRGTTSWACLTGSVQIAHCWLLLYQFTGKRRYRNAGCAANRYVRRTMKTNGPPEINGGIKGSFPINGGYNSYEYLNWACKFFIDSNELEKRVLEQDRKVLVESPESTTPL
jgi:hypothetical protein